MSTMSSLSLGSFLDCTWYMSARSAGLKGLRASKETGKSVYIIEDTYGKRFGVGYGEELPLWAESQMRLIGVIRTPSP